MIELVKDKLNSYPERGYCFPVDVSAHLKWRSFVGTLMTSTLITVKSSAFFLPTSTVPFTAIPTLSCAGSIAWFRIRKFSMLWRVYWGRIYHQGYRLVRQNAGRQEIHFLASGWDILGTPPPKATTAWIALSESSSENGCMRVIPGSHRHLQPHQETYAADNALSRGQEIAVDVNEKQAVDIVYSRARCPCTTSPSYTAQDRTLRISRELGSPQDICRPKLCRTARSVSSLCWFEGRMSMVMLTCWMSRTRRSC